MAIRINITHSGGGVQNYNPLKSNGKGWDAVDLLGWGVDKTTLDGLNHFGTSARFTDTLGGQTYANDMVCDWSTLRADGSFIMIKLTTVGDGSTWTYDLAHANIIAGTWGGYSDWKPANVAIVEELVNYGGSLSGTGRWLQPFQAVNAAKHIGTSTENMESNTSFYAYMNSTQFKQTWEKTSGVCYWYAVRIANISEL